MLTLTERLQEIMAAKGWGHADLMRVSKQSSSVVSQWLGKSSKHIKTITKLDAIIGIAEASGYSMMWIAQGRGPRFPAQPGTATPKATESSALPYTLDTQLEQFGMLLASIPVARRQAAANALAGWATSGGADVWRDMFLAAVRPSDKQPRRA